MRPLLEVAWILLRRSDARETASSHKGEGISLELTEARALHNNLLRCLALNLAWRLSVEDEACRGVACDFRRFIIQGFAFNFIAESPVRVARCFLTGGYKCTVVWPGQQLDVLLSKVSLEIGFVCRLLDALELNCCFVNFCFVNCVARRESQIMMHFLRFSQTSSELKTHPRSPRKPCLVLVRKMSQQNASL